MASIDLSKIIGFVLYMILEHGLGKTEFGSLIGLIGRLSKSIVAYLYSLFKKG